MEPLDFFKKVIKGDVAKDDGDWLQPLFRREEGKWRLSSLEVLFRLSDATRVPIPAFVDFVKAASDQSPDPDPELRKCFVEHVTSSLRRVDARMTKALPPEQLDALREEGLLTAINVTAKQLEAVLEVKLDNPLLLAIEETEYDDNPPGLSELRLRIWKRFGALSLDDVKPTMIDLEVDGMPVVYNPPKMPNGVAFKKLAEKYRHDLAFARGFISDFREAREQNQEVKGDIKFDEEFCCYLIGVGYAPFARDSMTAWRTANLAASDAIRAAGVALIQDALAEGLGVCFEVDFEDDDVGWLLEAVPHLNGRLSKQGGQSGPRALPQSVALTKLLQPLTLQRVQRDGMRPDSVGRAEVVREGFLPER